MPRSKRYIELKKLVDPDKVYKLSEAILLAKKTARTKFDSSLEAHFRLNIDASKGEQQVRGGVILPHGTGKTKKVAAFVTSKSEAAAKEAGADLVGGKELIDKIKTTQKIEFEVAVAEPELMKDLAVIAKILGPKGLMPSPKNETVAKDIKKAVAQLKGGKVNFKNDDTGNIHQIFGKTSFENQKLEENFKALYDAVKKAKPSGIKGNYLANVSINATMGPGIKISVE
ncbi:50S ribosomal protein L1 [Candidatus Parcubacteria bacterium]|nr:MAG: 50S ribosomal protein L1 [Candidatus Parcubacteria bacterium]